MLWGAPTYDQVRIAWDVVRRSQTADSMTQMRMIADYGEGSIIFRSLDDPDNARGHSADGAIFDEVGYIKERAYYEIVRPMLIDTEGWFWGMGTPNGRNWFWREFQSAHDDGMAARWQVPVVGCEVTKDGLVRKPHPLENPDIPFVEIESLYRSVSEAQFRQEVLAEFLEHEGSVFRNIAAAATLAVNPDAHLGHRIVVGVDWGKHQDFTAISVGCSDCKQEIDRLRLNQVDYAFQRKRLAAMLAKYEGRPKVLAEANAMGEPIIEELRRSGFDIRGFQTTATTKPPLIENLALAIEKAEWAFIDDPVWTGELEAYEQTTTYTGRPKYSAPEGMHDDTVIARALMVQAATSGQMVWAF